MECIQGIMEWAQTVLEQRGYGLAALPFAFVLGMVSAVASACCTLPLIGAIAGYSGIRAHDDSRTRWLAGLCFMLGTTLALIILGSIAGLVGQVAQDLMGRYWKVFAGLVAIGVGLGALRLLPFSLPSATLAEKSRPRGFLGAAVFGLVMGGGVCVASLCCNPGIFIVLGVAVLQGHTLWGLLIMTGYALGFSLPLTAIVLGVSFGKTVLKAQKAEAVIRIVAGILLLVAGFYFLATL